MQNSHAGIDFWKRYVDDTFMIVSEGRIEDFHRHLNGCFPDSV